MSIGASLVVFLVGVAVATLIYELLRGRVSVVTAATIGSAVTLIASYPLLRATDQTHLPFLIWVIWCLFSALAGAGIYVMLARPGKS